MKRIDSVKNEHVKRWKKLKTKKGRETTGRFLVEGYHLVEEAMKAKMVEYVLVTEEADQQSLKDEDIIIVSEQVLKELSETETPQGIAAVCILPNEPDVERLEGQYLLLDRVQDPGNLGTMIRTADAAGMTGIILGEGSVDVFNSKVIRASQGSIFHLPVIKGNLEEWVNRMKNAMIPVFGTALKEASSYTAVEPLEQFALIMGNEGEGLAPSLLELTDQNIYIPIHGEAESLNVAVAAGILLYYLKS
ncbi:TrmH family RNA methyltransferase [Halalkalibacter krulwichiae]|uniref:Putative TrmH family tRNA/rRNA methyltransferase n=1 Tax=Halalkalibacter krulwichiae TaxID=199441 RepID=A0A1X9MJ39_9BACI|nr:RNA methyltransferase [Halalkalibacter krulwichiae]ARK31671.1 Putative TrmH family tRNA/rRNA methyltransferase [Halalkalibacter krulwichiae]